MPTIGGIVVATGSESSGRRSLLEVVDELARPVNAADTTIRALAADAFRSAIRVMNRKGCWPWEQVDEDITMTVNSPLSTVTSAVKKPLAMRYLSAAGGTPDGRRCIFYEPYEQFVERTDWNITSDPSVYTIPNLFETGQIRWFPTPGTAESVRFYFYRVTPAPRNESETIEIPDYVSEAYMARAWFELVKRLPANQRPMPIDIAFAEARAAFREISVHVVAPGDRSREPSY